MFGNRNLLSVMLAGVFVLDLIDATPNPLPKTIEKLPYAFEALDIDNNEVVEYFIDIIPTKRHWEAVDFLNEHFLPNESVLKALGIHFIYYFLNVKN